MNNLCAMSGRVYAGGRYTHDHDIQSGGDFCSPAGSGGRRRTRTGGWFGPPIRRRPTSSRSGSKWVRNVRL